MGGSNLSTVLGICLAELPNRPRPTASNRVTVAARHEATGFDRDKTKRPHRRSDPATVAGGLRQPDQVEESVPWLWLPCRVQLVPPSLGGDRYHAEPVLLCLMKFFQPAHESPLSRLLWSFPSPVIRHKSLSLIGITKGLMSG